MKLLPKMFLIQPFSPNLTNVSLICMCASLPAMCNIFSMFMLNVTLFCLCFSFLLYITAGKVARLSLWNFVGAVGYRNGRRTHALHGSARWAVIGFPKVAHCHVTDLPNAYRWKCLTIGKECNRLLMTPLTDSFLPLPPDDAWQPGKAAFKKRQLHAWADKAYSALTY